MHDKETLEEALEIVSRFWKDVAEHGPAMAHCRLVAAIQVALQENRKDHNNWFVGLALHPATNTHPATDERMMVEETTTFSELDVGDIIQWGGVIHIVAAVKPFFKDGRALIRLKDSLGRESELNAPSSDEVRAIRCR